MTFDLPEKGRQVRVDDSLVTVRDADWADQGVIELFVIDAQGNPGRVLLTEHQLASGLVPVNDRGGNPERALTGLWGRWMQYAMPRIRSAVLATRPLQPYAHQDEAVHGHMLNQPRLRFLLGDEPGTGKTIMAGMYLAEGRRQGLIRGRVVIIVPAHLVTKWERDMSRLFGVEVRRLTAAMAAEPKDLDPRYDTWVVSVDLFTHNADVRRKLAGKRASWSLAIFDEAHRLTPTSQYLAAAREIADQAHHLLLLTATPHRGKEYYFRGLMNLLDPILYPWDSTQTEYATALVPSQMSFLRRMKEELVDHDGNKLFPPRFSETISVNLNPYEASAYDAVMAYVDSYYSDNATLALSIYGKRVASSLYAAIATVKRREMALKGAANERSSPVLPEDFLSSETFGSAIDDDEAWAEAEDALVRARTRDKTGELASVAALLEILTEAQDAAVSAKWHTLLAIIARHGIAPGQGQLLVFTEFADTARWLRGLFADTGFSVDLLEGAVDHRARDLLQERFLAGKYQVLVSTDAGGEGIDLQSANVMIDWDLPWSMVRLEQRMGRLHRIGQRNAVHVYHLIAPHTREGRVQEVMMQNLESAGRALEGKIYDLLDATAASTGFDWGKAMVDAQAGRSVTVPDSEALIRAARTLLANERTLSSPANVSEALDRFAADRLEAINPVIVDSMLDQLARSQQWIIGPGPAKGIRHVVDRVRSLPSYLGGEREADVASDGTSVRRAIDDGASASGLSDVIVLGPTEDAFQQLVAHAVNAGEEDLIRGASIVDSASLTSYVLALFDADIQLYDGTTRTTRKAPLLIRCSAGQTLPVAWESLMTLRAPSDTDSLTAGPTQLSPGNRHDATNEARSELRGQVKSLEEERRDWIRAAKKQLEITKYRFEESIAERPVEERIELLRHFEIARLDRLGVLNQIAEVSASAVRLVGWVAVAGIARTDQLGYDPNSEKAAISAVVDELEKFGFEVDDRQTAGVGYDLYARHPMTREQRLVEVKGLQGALRAVWLEQNEWAQAQQRGGEYWLYVVDSCASSPTVRLRLQDPSSVLGGPRRIERYQIRLSELSKLIGDQA
ncbi:helicase-related protein [Cryobacterium sp. Hz7]|uniref:helicase-related protein n=1 Tax=Cryobacterium sp. Hz7 TaxID=1259166 RepID=UPI00141A9E27|nr:helicase-related protein [Cryobacterium sp. Hz7]